MLFFGGNKSTMAALYRLGLGATMLNMEPGKKKI